MRKLSIEFITLLAGLMIILAVGVYWLSEGEEHDSADAYMLGQSISLEKLLAKLERKGEHYMENAPREYDAYFRDATIFHPGLLQDVDVLDDVIGRIASVNEQASHSGSMFADNAVAQHIQDLEQEWREFRSKLTEQLGVDPEMPRLEWGAEHITDQIQSVTSANNALLAALHEALGEFPGRTSGTGLYWVGGLILAWVLLSLIWFRVRVVSSS